MAFTTFTTGSGPLFNSAKICLIHFNFWLIWRCYTARVRWQNADFSYLPGFPHVRKSCNSSGVIPFFFIRILLPGTTATETDLFVLKSWFSRGRANHPQAGTRFRHERFLCAPLNYLLFSRLLSGGCLIASASLRLGWEHKVVAAHSDHFMEPLAA